RGGQREGGHQPAQVPLAARAAAGEAGGDRAVRAGLAAGRAEEAGPAAARGRAPPGRDPRHRDRGRAGPAGAARRAGGAEVTVLCLVEEAGGEAADVSLRALTFARQLAG